MVPFFFCVRVPLNLNQQKRVPFFPLEIHSASEVVGFPATSFGRRHAQEKRFNGSPLLLCLVGDLDLGDLGGLPEPVEHVEAPSAFCPGRRLRPPWRRLRLHLLENSFFCFPPACFKGNLSQDFVKEKKQGTYANGGQLSGFHLEL